MKKMRRKISMILVASMISLMVFGCNGKEAEKKEAGQKTLEFWTISLQPTFNDYFNGLIAEFEKENPNIKIKWMDYPKDVIQEKLLTAIASNKAPDVVNLNADIALALADKNALLDVEDYISEDTKTAFFDGIYDAVKTEQGTIALPWYTTVPVIYINEQILKDNGYPTDKYPTTAEEYFEWAIDVTEKTGVTGMAMEANIREMLGSSNVPIFNSEQSEILINSDEAVEVIEKFKEVYNKNANPKEILDQELRAQLYNSKQVVSVYSGTTFVNKFKTTAPEVYENTKVIPVPFDKSVSTTMYLSVPEKSENKEEAIKFAEMVTNAESQLEFSKTANTLPSTKATIEDEYFKKSSGTLEDEIKLAAVTSLKKSAEIPVPQDILDQVNRNLQDILFNNLNVKENMDKIVSEINAELK